MAPGGPDWPRVSERRQRQLLLEIAWRNAAGEAVARRAAAVSVDRGVLLLEIADPRWAAAVRALLPVAAARLARLHPDLGVRRFRIRAGAEGTPEPAMPLGPPAGGAPDPTEREQAPQEAGPPPIDEVAEAYLARFRGGRER